MTENDIENILRKPVLSNIEHKGALREKLFKPKTRKKETQNVSCRVALA